MTTYPIIPRPTLALWFWQRGIKRGKQAELIGCGDERAYRLCLPFDDALRTKPTDEELERIIEFTDGEISAPDFYPPHLNGSAPAEASQVAA